MQFDAGNPYHRYMLHYESEHQLSIAELIARGSIDAHIAAVLWRLLEQRASYIISGPTDPTPGVGKTTTLNSLLPFYPDGTEIVYTLGMYEQFDFLTDLAPQTATILANEISDHLRIYMWGNTARKLLTLPRLGHAIASSCHADTITDVLHMFKQDLHVPNRDMYGLQIIVNIGLTGVQWPQKRRWFTTYFIAPHFQATPGKTSAKATDLPDIKPMLISAWDHTTDTFTKPPAETLAAMAAWAGISPVQFAVEVAEREKCLQDLAARHVDIDEFYAEIIQFRQKHQ